MPSPLLAGFLLGLSLIVAIGAQNLFVLRQGVRRAHVLAVALVCATSDAVLIVLGVSGVGLVLQTVPWLIVAARWAGALFLLGYGLLAARRAWRPSARTLEMGEPERQEAMAGPRDAATPARRVRAGTGDAGAGGIPSARRDGLAAAVATCLALTWLNPHVYLDTVFLLGSVASTHGDGRWLFAAGAVTASVAWFFGLAYGARSLGRWLASPRAWRILDAVIAVVMIALAVSLVLPHA